MSRVTLGNHNYHHSTGIKNFFGHECIYYSPERDNALFSAVANDIAAIGLDNDKSTMCTRFAGFKYTQSAIEALIANGIKFFCDGKRYKNDIHPRNYHYSHYVTPIGELRGIATSWWSDYRHDWPPDYGRPYSLIQYTLDRSKPTMLGGHLTQTWRPEYEPGCTERFEEFLTRIESDYPMAEWEFPQDFQPFIEEIDDYNHIIVSQIQLFEEDSFECRFSFEGAASSGETLIFEDGTDYELRYAYVNDTEVLVSRRAGYYFIILPNLPFGNHIVRLFNDESLKEQDPLSFTKVYSYPNPTDGPVTLKAIFTEPVGDINVKICTITGDVVYETEDFDFNPYDYSYESFWRLNNKRGGEVANGVYLCLWTATRGSQEFKAVHKIAVLK
jgi:hypothetical protein